MAREVRRIYERRGGGVSVSMLVSLPECCPDTALVLCVEPIVLRGQPAGDQRKGLCQLEQIPPSAPVGGADNKKVGLLFSRVPRSVMICLSWRFVETPTSHHKLHDESKVMNLSLCLCLCPCPCLCPCRFCLCPCLTISEGKS